MSTLDTTPGITKTAFACPHCGAYTTQHWYHVYIEAIDEEAKTPTMPDRHAISKILATDDMPEEEKQRCVAFVEQTLLGRPFADQERGTRYGVTLIYNCFISQCYNCSEFLIWVGDSFIYPPARIDIKPNCDLSPEIVQLFNEARDIVGQSPRGAAAMLRLCVQHLCRDLGEEGVTLDSDIASLVAKGLSPMVQQALDVVRVIGNESVHPGEIDLNDDADTAVQLFSLVNLIAEQMISHPRRVKELYDSLPAGKLEAIGRRNAKAKKDNSSK